MLPLTWWEGKAGREGVERCFLSPHVRKGREGSREFGGGASSHRMLASERLTLSPSRHHEPKSGAIWLPI